MAYRRNVDEIEVKPVRRGSKPRVATPRVERESGKPPGPAKTMKDDASKKS